VGRLDADALPLPAEQAEDLDRPVSGRTEPVRQPGVGVGGFTGTQGDVVVGEKRALRMLIRYQGHPPGRTTPVS
jgi:hypothetical protein